MKYNWLLEKMKKWGQKKMGTKIGAGNKSS